MQEVVRLHASSGTTGKPIVVAYTEADLQVWTSVMVRSFAACGLHQGDVVQNAYGYGLFTGGLGVHYAAEAIGATVIPVSGGFEEGRFFTRKNGALMATPLFIVLLVVETTDLVFELSMHPGMDGPHDYAVHLKTSDSQTPDLVVRVLSNWGP